MNRPSTDNFVYLDMRCIVVHVTVFIHTRSRCCWSLSNAIVLFVPPITRCPSYFQISVLEFTIGYICILCMGPSTSPDIDTSLKAPTGFSVSSERHRQRDVNEIAQVSKWL